MFVSSCSACSLTRARAAANATTTAAEDLAAADTGIKDVVEMCLDAYRERDCYYYDWHGYYHHCGEQCYQDWQGCVSYLPCISHSTVVYPSTA